MKEYREEEFLQLAGIQHFIFCRRQWALIHIEQQWQENYLTAMGTVMHHKVHDSFGNEKRKHILISRGMPVQSRKLGIQGVCDVVEFQQDENGISIRNREGTYQIMPIEYKRGKSKEDKSDVMQVTAQALCLEEMFCCEIPKAALFYGETKRREYVTLTQELRDECKAAYEEMHKLYERNYTPNVKYARKCQACSLKDSCLPKMQKSRSAQEYMENIWEETE